jgi:hypothetical protein
MNHSTISLNQINPKRASFNTIFKDAYRYGFSSQDPNTQYYTQIHNLNKYCAAEKNVSISQCYMSIDINKFLYKSSVNKRKHFARQTVEFLENGEVYSQPAIDYISERMECGHVITVTLSLEKYIYEHDENTHVTHSTLLIFHPKTIKGISTSTYNMFYINSHGGSLLYTNFHEKPIGRKRNSIKKTTFDKSIDFIVNNAFVKALNQYNREYQVKTHVCYDLTRQHNYLGINLQAYDNYGACFIFPILFNLLIHTNYNKYFINKNGTYSIIVEKTVECFLETNDIDLFVYHALAQIDDRINTYLTSYYSNMKELNKQRKKKVKTRTDHLKTICMEETQEELYDSIDKHLDIYTHRFVKATLTKTIQFIKQDWSMYQPEVFV